MCVCVCVNIYIYMCVYVCVCVRVCACLGTVCTTMALSTDLTASVFFSKVLELLSFIRFCSVDIDYGKSKSETLSHHPLAVPSPTSSPASGIHQVTDACSR